jgi:hypothetical protein
LITSLRCLRLIAKGLHGTLVVEIGLRTERGYK